VPPTQNTLRVLNNPLYPAAIRMPGKQPVQSECSVLGARGSDAQLSSTTAGIAKEIPFNPPRTAC
jgi:hypothetical protein